MHVVVFQILEMKNGTVLNSPVLSYFKGSYDDPHEFCLILFIFRVLFR